jgi:hypothetical protein
MGALSSLASVGLNLALADQAQKRQAKEINAARDDDIRKIEQRDAEEQRRAADRLRRQLATQRARAGAAGLGNSASSTAVLRGLVQQAAELDQALRDESSQAIEAINQGARNARRANLLDLANTTARRGLSQLGGSQRSSLLDR